MIHLEIGSSEPWGRESIVSGPEMGVIGPGMALRHIKMQEVEDGLTWPYHDNSRRRRLVGTTGRCCAAESHQNASDLMLVGSQGTREPSCEGSHGGKMREGH